MCETNCHLGWTRQHLLDLQWLSEELLRVSSALVTLNEQMVSAPVDTASHPAPTLLLLPRSIHMCSLNLPEDLT